jgi:hypothetical protein
MKKKTTQDNKKTFKNYAILFGITLAFVCIVLYLCKCYNVYNEYQKEIPVIRGSLQEIVSDDLEHYLVDNPSSIIYICVANDDKCREFEKKFKKYVETKLLSDEIVYLNTTGLNQDEFVKNFNERYAKKKELTTNYPAIVLFEDGKAVSILQGKKNSSLSIEKVENFLEVNKIGE